jgi:hypothetical protein
MRTYVVPYFRGTRIGDLGRADVKAFIDHLRRAAGPPPAEGSHAPRRLDDPQDHDAAEGDARRGLRA